MSWDKWLKQWSETSGCHSDLRQVADTVTCEKWNTLWPRQVDITVSWEKWKTQWPRQVAVTVSWDKWKTQWVEDFTVMWIFSPSLSGVLSQSAKVLAALENKVFTSKKSIFVKVVTITAETFRLWSSAPQLFYCSAARGWWRLTWSVRAVMFLY